jgi:hypothetical protein
MEEPTKWLTDWLTKSMQPTLNSQKTFSYTRTALVYGNRKFNLLLPTARSCSLRSAQWIHSTTAHSVSLRYTLMLSAHLPWCRLPQAPCEISISSLNAASPAQLIPLYSTILKLFREQFKLSSFSFSRLAPSSLFYVPIFVQCLFSATLESVFFPRDRPRSEPIQSTEEN